MGADVGVFIRRWEGSSASERASAQQFVTELCEVLGVSRPEPSTGDPAADTYVFEYPVKEPHEDGKPHRGWIDLYKAGHFLLEAKQGGTESSAKRGTARRDRDAWNLAMQKA